MAKKNKSTLIVAAGVVLILLLCFLGYRFWRNRQDWSRRFEAELDVFFGEGNWESLSEETKKSRIYTVRQYFYNTAGYESSRDVPGDYHNWDICFTNRDGVEEIWTITDHAMRINHSKNHMFSRDRYSAKQSFVQQLMNISFAVSADKLHQEILQMLLPEEEAACLEIDISWRGGNPPPEMYDELAEQSWFTAQQATVENYLESSLYDFYVWIHAQDYRVEKLTEQQRQHLMGSLGELENALKKALGAHADYEIYLDAEHTAEFSAE